MLRLSRRSLLAGVSIAAADRSAKANNRGIGLWLMGGRGGGSGQQASINLSDSDSMFMNFLKNAGSITAGAAPFPGLLSVDGYPTSAYSGTSQISGTFNQIAEYYGHCNFQFAGQGALQITAGLGYIVYNGGAFCGLGTNTGFVGFNLTLAGTNPQCEIALGFLLSAVANNGSGQPRFTLTSSVLNNVSSALTVQVNNVTGVTPGLYLATKVDNSHVDLLTLSYNAGMAVVGGGPGSQSEMIAANAQQSFNFPTAKTYGSDANQMSNAVLCRIADSNGSNPYGLQNGYQINADLISQIRSLKPKFIRFLAMSGVIASIESNWTYRRQLTNFSYNSDLFVPSYWVGAITWNSGDDYTCSNPAASGSGAYQDGEIVQGQFAAANLGVASKLNVNGRGSVPIFTNAATQQTAVFGGSVPTTGSTVSLTFTASYFSGGVHTFNYTVQSSDTTIGLLVSHIITALNNDVTLTGSPCNFIFETGTNSVNMNYNNNAGALTFGSSLPSGLTVSYGTTPVGTIVASAIRSMLYSGLLGGFVLSGTSGLGNSTPVELQCEVCSRSGTIFWDQIPLFYSAASASARATKIGSFVSQMGCELSNEVWNFAQNQTWQAIALGSALGFGGNNNTFYLMYGYHALRFMQLICGTMIPAWITAGRSRQSFATLMMNWLAEGNGGSGLMVSQHWNGSKLTTSGNSTYAALGGLGATPTATDYDAFPNRPADWMDFIGYAPYPQGALVGETASSWSGSQTPYNALLQASADYATGLPSLMQSALAAWDADVAAGSFATFSALYNGFETALRAYDNEASPNRGNGGKIGVACYEMALQEGLGNSFSGTNNTGNDATGYAPMLTQLNNLVSGSGWIVAPTYGASTTVVAQNLVNLFLAYLNSQTYFNRWLQFYHQITVAHAGRQAFPTQFGYSGPSIWTMYPGDIYSSPYQNFAAIQSYNS